MAGKVAAFWRLRGFYSVDDVGQTPQARDVVQTGHARQRERVVAGGLSATERLRHARTHGVFPTLKVLLVVGCTGAGQRLRWLLPKIYIRVGWAFVVWLVIGA